MTKGNMIKYYRKFSAADSYIIGFSLDHKVYMTKVAEIMPRMLRVEEASRNQGENLRFRLTRAEKMRLVKYATLLGNDSILIDKKWNKGEMFEKAVTEHFGQTWVKDIVSFTKQGDINVNGEEIQIKFENATLMNTVRMHRLQKAAR